MSSSVYYGLNLNTRNLTGDLYLNIFFSGLVEIPALVFVVLVHNKLGRRLTVCILMTITGVFCFSILVLDIIGKSRKGSSGDKNISILHLSCRTSDLQFSLVLSFKSVCNKEHNGDTCYMTYKVPYITAKMIFTQSVA